MPTGVYTRTKECIRIHKEALSRPEARKKMIESHLGNRNRLWKGNAVGYDALHNWVNRVLGKAKKCSVCGKEGTGREIHWANIDHKYRRNVEDYRELCCQCHGEYDKNNNLRKHK